MTMDYRNFYIALQLAECASAIALYVIAFAIQHFRHQKIYARRLTQTQDEIARRSTLTQDGMGRRSTLTLDEMVKRHVERERKMGKVIALLITVYTFTTLPANIFRYIRYYTTNPYVSNALTNGSGYLLMINALVNVIVYMKKNDEINNAVIERFFQIFLCRNSTSNDHLRETRSTRILRTGGAAVTLF